MNIIDNSIINVAILNSKILGDNARTEEDYVMFCKFWPKFIAKMLTKIYGTSEKSNDL